MPISINSARQQALDLPTGYRQHALLPAYAGPDERNEHFEPFVVSYLLFLFLLGAHFLRALIDASGRWASAEALRKQASPRACTVSFSFSLLLLSTNPRGTNLSLPDPVLCPRPHLRTHLLPSLSPAPSMISAAEASCSTNALTPTLPDDGLSVATVRASTTTMTTTTMTT